MADQQPTYEARRKKLQAAIEDFFEKDQYVTSYQACQELLALPDLEPLLKAEIHFDLCLIGRAYHAEQATLELKAWLENNKSYGQRSALFYARTELVMAKSTHRRSRKRIGNFLDVGSARKLGKKAGTEIDDLADAGSLELKEDARSKKNEVKEKIAARRTKRTTTKQELMENPELEKKTDWAGETDSAEEAEEEELWESSGSPVNKKRKRTSKKNEDM